MPVTAANQPYTGEPIGPGPEFVPTPGFRIPAATPAAFGAGVGEAVRGLGTQLGQSANELAQNVLWQQELHNRITADDTNNKFLEEMTQKLRTGPDALFTKEGQDFLKAYPAVMRDLEATRQRYASSLNMQARTDFNRMSLYYTRNEFNQIGAHADMQQKTYAANVAKDSADINLRGIGTHPDDLNAVEADTAALMKARLDHEEILNGRFAGDPNAATRIYAVEGRTRADATTAQIEALAARDNLDQATAIYKDAQNRGVPFDADHQLRIGNMLASAQNRAENAGVKTDIAGESARILGRPGAAVIPYAAGDVLKNTQLSQADYDKFRGRLANLESDRYDQPPNKEGYMGRYQMGTTEIKNAATRLGIAVPSQKEFLGDPQLQERLFEAYTDANHLELMKNPVYANASPGQRAALLAGAHLTGVTNLNRYLETGQEYADRLGTTPSKYIQTISRTMGVSPILPQTASQPSATGTTAAAPGGPDRIVTPLPPVTVTATAAGPGEVAQPIPPGQAPVDALRPDFDSMLDQAYALDDGTPRGARVSRGVVRNIQSEITKWNRETSGDRHKLKSDLENTDLQLMRGSDVPLVSEDHIRHLLPPEEANDAIEKQRDAQLLGNARNGIKTKTFAEIQTDIAALDAGKGFPGVHDVRMREAGENAYKQEAARYLKAMFGGPGSPADPAGELLTHPQWRDQGEALTQLPAPKTAADWPAFTQAHENYAHDMLGAQDKFGLPPQIRHVLSQSQATDYAARLTNDPANAHGLLGNLAQQWGTAWPQVWSDIAGMGKMSTAYQAIGVIPDHYSFRLAQGLADERGEEGDKKGLQVWTDRFGATQTTGPEGVITAVRGDQDLAPFVKSMVGASEPQVNSVLHAVDTLAFSLMAREQMTVGDAVSAAVHAFTDLYEFMPQGGARVPKANYEAVSTAAASTVAGLEKDKVTLPPGIAAGPGTPTAEDYIAAIKFNPVWINGKDGVELIDYLRARRVLDQNGQPITVPFNVVPPAKPPAAAPIPVPPF
jgi:hypothetical protein